MTPVRLPTRRYCCNARTARGRRCFNRVSRLGQRCHLHHGVGRADSCWLDFMDGHSVKSISERRAMPVREVEDRIRKEMGP